MIAGDRLTWLLKVKLKKDQVQTNLLMRELTRNGWLHTLNGSWYSLTDAGWALVKYELDKPPPGISILELAQFLTMYGPLTTTPPKKPEDQ